MNNHILKNSLKFFIKEAILEKRHQPSKDRPATKEDLDNLFKEFEEELSSKNKKNIENFFHTDKPTVNALTKYVYNITDPNFEPEKDLD